MSHSCPNCGELCYCGNDVEDCLHVCRQYADLWDNDWLPEDWPDVEEDDEDLQGETK